MEHTLQPLNTRIQSRNILIMLQLLVLVFALSTIQDFWHSTRNNYSFYISESLLFNTFWLLFFPMTIALFFLRRRKQDIFVSRFKLRKIAGIIIVASVLHILIYCFLLQLLSAIFFSHDYLFMDNLSYTMANDFYKYPLVYGVIGLFLFQKTESKIEDKRIKNPDEINSVDKFFIQKGRESIAILTENIISITSSSPYIAIQTGDKKYLHQETLKSMLMKLNENQFVRIHKSCIINIEKVQSYKSRLNGDYDIVMHNGETLRLSRNYVKNFREKLAVMPDSFL